MTGIEHVVARVTVCAQPRFSGGIAMGQRSGSTKRVSEERASGGGGGAGSRIVLSHQNIVAGIAFHLVDLGRADAVEAGGMEKTLRRLERGAQVATVERGDWEAMSDATRLDWLLAMSQTAYVLSTDRVAVLGRR